MSVVRILVMAGLSAALAGAAGAQKAGFGDATLSANGHGETAARFNDGVSALHAGNFQVAAGAFKDVLTENPNDVDANSAEGEALSGLNQFKEARVYLEKAARLSPRTPDPRGRLGWVDVKLGDMNAAMKVRAELEKMDKDCKQKCRSATAIADDLHMIDSAMVASPAPAKPAG